MGRNKNKNLCKVKIKKDRTCCHCGELICSGTLCLTINPMYEKRKWMCPTCLDLVEEIDRLDGMYDSLSFGDEGGAMAIYDARNEVISELEDRER